MTLCRHCPGLVLTSRRPPPTRFRWAFDQGQARLRAQALQAAGTQQYARDRELVRGDRHARSARTSSNAGTPSSPTSPISMTWARTPTIAIYMYKKLVEKANGSTKLDDMRKIDCHRRGLHRRARRQGLHRPEEPAYVAPHAALSPSVLSTQVTVQKVYGTIQPYWLVMRLRPHQEENTNARFTPSNPPAEDLIRQKEARALPWTRQRRGQFNALLWVRSASWPWTVFARALQRCGAREASRRPDVG